jgi:hypothetical protein
MARVHRGLWASVVALSLLSGCKKLEAKGEGEVIDEDGNEVVVVEVQTEPEAKVFVLDMPSSKRVDRIDYAGETAGDWVIAGSDGKATLRLPIWATLDAEQTYSIGVWRGKEPIPFRRTPRLDFDVTVERPARIFVTDGKVSCVGKRKCNGIVRKDLALVLDDVKDGTKGSIAGGAVVTAAAGKLVAQPDFAALFQGVELEAALKGSAGDLKLPITLEFEGGPKLTRDAFVPKTALRDVVTAQLKYPEKGPILFPGETADAKGTGAMWTVVGDVGQLYGRAKVPSDVDFVTIRDATKRTLDCGRYVGDSGASAVLTIDVTDATVTVYQRRTGKKFATHVIKARAACPETYIKTDQWSFQDKQAQTFSQEDLDAWLNEFVAAPEKFKGAKPAAPGGGGAYRLDGVLY